MITCRKLKFGNIFGLFKGDQPHELLQSKAEVNLLIQGQRKQISFRTLTTRVTNLPWDLARPQ